ncbi:hypothetical protein [Roseomonas sp. USHLN139]|uniref:hypothetical protein n=1 Tax=Roseomonas sp. USHLN139 TaxID=3081298 RepID=UPI003B02EA3E
MFSKLTYPNAIGLLSAVAAALAIYLALVDKVAAAATMGGLFLVMAVVHQLPRFKSFKAFSVEAQLQDRLERADELIEQLRSLSLLVAKAGYASTGISTMAFGGVQGSGDKLTRDFDELLGRLKLSRAELADVRQPLVRGIGFRLCANFQQVISSLPYHEGLVPRNIGEMMTSEHARLLSIDSGADLRTMLAMYPPGGLSQAQRSAADRYIDRLVSLYEGCQKAGGPTPEFMALEARALSGIDAGEAALAIFEGRASSELA